MARTKLATKAKGYSLDAEAINALELISAHYSVMIKGYKRNDSETVRLAIKKLLRDLDSQNPLTKDVALVATLEAEIKPQATSA